MGMLEGEARGVFGKTWTGTSHLAGRDQFSREYLRDEATRSGANVPVSAVGSLQEDLRPGEFLVVDQFVDRTKSRVSTFFGGGLVAHVAFDKPTCPQTSAVLADASARCGVKAHPRGTYVCVEGHNFSSLAEAHLHRQLRFEVIGMTNVTEAKLALEAEFVTRPSP